MLPIKENETQAQYVGRAVAILAKEYPSKDANELIAMAIKEYQKQVNR